MPGLFAMGRVCYKVNGRDAGTKVIVVGDAKEGFVTVEGTKTKKSRANMQHLLPTQQKVSLPASYTKKDIQKALKGE